MKSSWLVFSVLLVAVSVTGDFGTNTRGAVIYSPSKVYSETVCLDV